MVMKNPMTPAGIEPATFQFVAQHLNHCATAVPTFIWYVNENNIFKIQDVKFTNYKKGTLV